MKRDFVLLVFSLITWGLGEGMFLNFQPIYLQQLGADPIRIGGILGAYGIATTLVHLPAGYLADRIGRRRLMLAAWFLGTFATWVMALARSLPIFVVGLLLYGTTLFVLSPLNSYVTAARGRLSVGRALTLTSASFNFGGILGPWLGGNIAETLGLRQIYLISAILFALSTLIVLFTRPQPVARPHLIRSEPGIFMNRTLFMFLVLVFFSFAVMYLPQALSPNYLQNILGLGLENIGALYAIGGLGIVALNLLLGYFDARIGFLLGQVAVGIFALIMWLGTDFSWLAIGYFLLGGYRVSRSLAAALVRTLVDESAMGLAYGYLETAGGAATILTPLLAGYLFDQNPAWMYSITVVLTLPALWAVATFRFPGWKASKFWRAWRTEARGD